MEQQQQLLQAATNEFKTHDIERIVATYKSLLDEFCAVSEHFRLAQPRYNETFERLVNIVGEEYNVERSVMYVRLGNYGTNVWGNLYWRFLHHTSILLEQAMHNNRINDPLDFPLLVYNIDCILPCANCALHYRRIKETADVKTVIKDMSFGMLVNGLQAFHNLVTRNVDKLPEYAGMPDRPTFTMIDFARTYGCIERLPDDLLKSNIYVRPRIDWQPNTHRMLTIFYALATKRTYSPCSDALKLALYDREIAATVVPSSSGINNESRESIMSNINRAILMNVDEQVVSGNAQIYNQTIVEFYHAFPEYVRSLIDCDDDNANANDADREAKTRIKEKILLLLDKVASAAPKNSSQSYM